VSVTCRIQPSTGWSITEWILITDLDCKLHVLLNTIHTGYIDIL